MDPQLLVASTRVGDVQPGTGGAIVGVGGAVGSGDAGAVSVVGRVLGRVETGDGEDVAISPDVVGAELVARTPPWVGGAPLPVPADGVDVAAHAARTTDRAATAIADRRW